MKSRSPGPYAPLVLMVLGACGSTVSAPPTPEGCPPDLLAAVGTACAPEGTTCSDPGTVHRLLMCSGGTWAEMNVPPMPPPPSGPPPSVPEPSTGCPPDLLAAVGTPCAPDGMTCHEPGAIHRLLMCSGGTWTEMNVSPPPPSSAPPTPVP